LPDYAGLPPDNVNFVIDGRFYDQDEKLFDGSFFGVMRQYFVQAAGANGYDVIDLKPILADRFARHHERFDTDRDGHWNALGHDVVAAALGAYYGGRLGSLPP
jgi:hypothetical protein